MGHRLIRIYITPLLVSCSAVFPWYLFARFVLKLDLNLEALSIGIAMLAYIPLVVVRRWEEGVRAEERERVVEKYATLYGKTVALWVSIQFLIAVLGVLLFLMLR